MTDLNLNASTSLPDKSSLWIGGNIAAAIIFSSFILGYLATAVLGSTINQSLLSGLLLTLILAVLGSWLGIKYVAGKTRIDPGSIFTISLIAAGIPFLIYLLFLVLGPIMYEPVVLFNWQELLFRFGIAVVVFLAVQFFLRQKVV